MRAVWVDYGPIARVVAEHDGYVSRFGLRHRRTVEFDGTSRIAITDELLGASHCREVTVSFLLRSGMRGNFRARWERCALPSMDIPLLASQALAR